MSAVLAVFSPAEKQRLTSLSGPPSLQKRKHTFTFAVTAAEKQENTAAKRHQPKNSLVSLLKEKEKSSHIGPNPC